MRKQILIPFGVLLLLSSCLEENDVDAIDLEPPQIMANAGQGSIQPVHFFKTDALTEEIPLAFTVEDESGIGEIKIDVHSGFDGHTHGKSASARNPKFKLFNHNEVMDATIFQDANRHTVNASLYLDARNPDLEEDELILGGVYHFSVQATDMEGNETNYRENTTYHTTLYVNRPYAPQVDFANINVSTGTLNGRIYRNMDHSASSDITLLWIYAEQSNTDNPAQEGLVLEERLWGTSNWPHQSRANEGQPLPNGEELDLQQLIGDDSDFLAKLQPDTKLVVWAEDTNGNISVHQFTINN